MDNPRFEYLLRLGDNTLILGQQLSAWCGHCPVLEEDIALANTALDLIGQSIMWLHAAGASEGDGRSADDLAYQREARGFRNALLVEQPNGDYGQTLMRSYLFDAWHYPLLLSLSNSQDDEISAVAGKAVKEAKYHLDRSTDLIVHLASGTEESHKRMQNALDLLWPFAKGMAAADDLDQRALDEGFGADIAEISDAFLQKTNEVFSNGNLRFDPDVQPRSGGKTGIHSENLGFILAEMQILQRSHPGASW